MVEQSDRLNNSKRGAMFFNAIVWGVFLCACLGLICRLTIKDSVPYIAILFYAFKPVILALSFFLSAWYFKRRVRVVMVGALLASAACFYWWVDTGFALNSHVSIQSSEENYTYKTFLWNTFHGRGGWDKIADEIAECKADLVVLTEADTDSKRPNFWTKRFPSHHVRQFEHSILVISRGNIKNVKAGNLAGYSHFVRFETTFDQRTFAVYAVDFYSGPFNSRRSAFEQLLQLVSRDYYLPVMVLGDFNTPEESYFFDGFRKRKFTHAFSSTGSGMKATWPLPCPFLDLDHAWVSSKIRLLESKLGWSALSDHRPLLFEFDFEEEQVPTLWAKLYGHDPILEIQ